MTARRRRHGSAFERNFPIERLKALIDRQAGGVMKQVSRLDSSLGPPRAPRYQSAYFVPSSAVSSDPLFTS